MKSISNSGFTLIEIIIALAIVSISIVSLMNAMNSQAHVSGELEKRVVSGWIASNVIAEARHSAKTERLKTGNKSDTLRMGGHRWRTRTRITETDVENVFLVTVEVRNEEDSSREPITTMTTAITDPT